MGETRDAVDDEEDVLALVAEMLGDGDGRQRRHLAKHRALVAGCDDGDRLPHIAAERILDEFAHLAAALADKRNDDLVEGIGAGEHGERPQDCTRRNYGA